MVALLVAASCSRYCALSDSANQNVSTVYQAVTERESIITSRPQADLNSPNSARRRWSPKRLQEMLLSVAAREH